MSFFFTCTYVFLLFLRPQDWLAPGLAPYRPLNLIALAALGTCALQIMQGEIKVPQKTPHLWLVIGLLGGVLMSHIAHTYFAGFMMALEDFSKVTLISLLVLFTVNSVHRLKVMSMVVLGMAIFISIHCLLQAHRGVGFADYGPLVVSSRVHGTHVRAKFVGIFNDPNDTAFFLVAALPLVFFLFPWSHPLSLVLGFATGGLLIAGIYATQSRGGFLSLAIMTAVFFRRFLSVRQFIIASVLGAVVLTTVLPARMAQLGLIESSATDRVKFWGEANYAFKANPLFGVGYRLLVSDYMEGARATHNSFVQAYAELGVFGYSFWFGLLGMAFLGCWQVGNLLPESADERSLVRFARFMVPALAGLYAGAYFLSRTYHMPLFVLLLMCGACYRLAGDCVGHDQLNDFTGVSSKKMLYWWPGLTIGSIAFIYVSILIVNRIA